MRFGRKRRRARGGVNEARGQSRGSEVAASRVDSEFGVALTLLSPLLYDYSRNRQRASAHSICEHAV